MAHPNLIYYGESTLTASFDLVLVVGREPNDNGPMSQESGPYDFDANASPHCAFWNTSYGFAARHAPPPMSCRELKDECRRVKASPILYADALPITIQNKTQNKAQRRAAVTDAEIEHHVEGVLAHSELLSRVKLVLLSGLHPGLERSTNAYRAGLAKFWRDQRGPYVANVPFFFGTNMPKFDELKHCPQEVHDKLREIMASFVRHAGSVPR